ncbi:MAG: UMP kinase [Candidatus Komeilibacteria bacterium CG11_big_fil_rev_8_21_14_0_20_36_20]|uniref:Uridylate kinase n=1 Tax=Candidatus Komeilibacteria bacterium CG11_big_fil_rev_8_21_14_0_20_36_20 TaxID=1974477 RepID=A0A2H0NAY0_9BACT|nr:MAG: UMP kinase [Candidatus Komeilibacteria bacterium CG11_big_fil_rev_8_21_14_0_20_36_20]PIR82060.1 MAG: UMP kinase [Candidatus Komeilibacteria bacterium CG10_big_fil_rev_8_21_14_0_10_36_65]PJC55039.1 MAG: UMP kinase [Candidatus Komeilibacteria bacterium CG_4_9_14_0_2_um_filter_36_13]
MVNKRIVIKISGQALETGNSEANLDFAKIKKIALSLQKLIKAGYQVGVVLGAGNIFRARMVKHLEIDRVAADHMGMMATLVNALALQSVLENIGQEVRVLSSFSIPAIAEDYVYKRAINHLNNKRVVIFAGGTGNPYFTTDTTLVLRALEIGATTILKASDVNGVYDDDPDENPKAKLYKALTYQEALDKKLRVMDATAFALAKENNLLLKVFKFTPQNIFKAVIEDKIGTKVCNSVRDLRDKL